MKKIGQKFGVFICAVVLLIAGWTVFPAPAWASGDVAVLSASSTSVAAGETFTVTAGFSSNEALLAVEMQVGYSTGVFELVSAEKVSATEVGSGNPFKVLFDSADGSKSATLVKLTLRVKDGTAGGTTGTITVQNAFGADSGFQNIPLTNASVTVTVATPLSGNATLSSLSLNEAAISPAFASGTTSYTASVGNTVSKVTVNAKAADSTAKVTVSGGSSLKVGSNKITVTVTAKNGTSKSYVITVTRAAAPVSTLSNNAKLKSLTLTGFSLPFSPTITEYALTVPNDTTALEVTAEAAESDAQVSISGHTKLQVGMNYVIIKVTAPDGKTTKQYNIGVTRAAASSQATSSQASSSVSPSSKPPVGPVSSAMPASSEVRPPESSVAPESGKPAATSSEKASSQEPSSADASSEDAPVSSTSDSPIQSNAFLDWFRQDHSAWAIHAAYIGGMGICLLAGCILGYFIRGRRDK